MTTYFVDGFDHQEMTMIFYQDGGQYAELVAYLESRNYSSQAADAIANDFINNVYEDALGDIESYR